MTILSENLKKARKAAGFHSQQQAAEALGIKRSLLGAHEEGRCQPQLQVFVKIIEVYRIADWKGLILDEHFDPAAGKILKGR